MPRTNVAGATVPPAVSPNDVLRLANASEHLIDSTSARAAINFARYGRS